LEVDENEREKKFLAEQVLKAQRESKRIKAKLSNATSEYDVLYLQAQDFLKNCNDK